VKVPLGFLKDFFLPYDVVLALKRWLTSIPGLWRNIRKTRMEN